jgi:hypothetical protein
MTTARRNPAASFAAPDGRCQHAATKREIGMKAASLWFAILQFIPIFMCAHTNEPVGASLQPNAVANRAASGPGAKP